MDPKIKWRVVDDTVVCDNCNGTGMVAVGGLYDGLYMPQKCGECSGLGEYDRIGWARD